ncbi:MAG TPA: hypothetical protein VNU19_12495 [Candidatus Acidoferrum sp.]|nr:hypothetical protein [Candidatus Acidoferrum sp.]
MRIDKSIVAAIAVGLLVNACGSSPAAVVPTPSPALPSPSPTDTKNMVIAIASTFVQTVPVAVSTNFDLDIEDVGTVDIPNLYLTFDAGDLFMAKYTIESAGPCRVDAAVTGALACGRLAKGAHLVFTIKGTPKNTGTFVIKFHVNQYKTHLYEADGTQYVYSWTQTVTA